MAKLPFKSNPNLRLKTNKKVAEKVYWSQLRRLGKTEVDREQVIEAEKNYNL